MQWPTQLREEKFNFFLHFNIMVHHQREMSAESQGRYLEAGTDTEARSEFSLLGFLIIAHEVFLSSSTKDLQPRGSTGHISGLSNINRQSRKSTTGFSMHQYSRGFCQLRFCLYKWVYLVSNWHKSSQHIIFLLFLYYHSIGRAITVGIERWLN